MVERETQHEPVSHLDAARTVASLTTGTRRTAPTLSAATSGWMMIGSVKSVCSLGAPTMRERATHQVIGSELARRQSLTQVVHPPSEGAQRETRRGVHHRAPTCRPLRRDEETQVDAAVHVNSLVVETWR